MGFSASYLKLLEWNDRYNGDYVWPTVLITLGSVVTFLGESWVAVKCVMERVLVLVHGVYRRHFT